jgi:cysteine-S-conjugate beta-lyase
VSFGSVNSLISLPGAMSHASIPAEVRAAREFPEDLIRISIGIESAVDLIADLRKAMSTYTGAGVTAANTKTAAAGGSSGATDESNAKA